MKSLCRLLAFFVLSGLFSCKGKEQTSTQISSDVNVVPAGQKTVPVYTEYVGETYGISDVEIQTRVDGWVMSMHFKEGDAVKKGQLLYVIDDQQILTRIDAATARVSEANTNLTRTKADLDRVEPLTKMNALSQRDLDAAVASYQSSQAEVEAAKAALKNARIELGYTHIMAPISGTIGISKFQPGDYVSRGTLNGVLNTISAIGEVRVRFPISESEYLRFAKKIRSDTANIRKIVQVPVEIVLGDGSVYPEKGKLDLVNRQVDAETGSLLVQAVFQNKERILRPGQYVKVRFKTDEYNDAILVPQQAVNQMQSIYQVYLINDSNKIEPRVIKVGARVGSNWIVTDGLKPGEKVAILGNALINPGMTVTPVTKDWNYDSTSGN